MDDANAVEVHQRVQDLPHVVLHFRLRQLLALLHELGEGLVVRQLQQHVVCLFILEEVVEPHHVLVPQ